MYKFDSLDSLIKEASAPTASQLFDKYVLKEKRFSKDEFNALLYVDPTYAKGDKIGSYTLWLIKMFRTIPDRVFEDANKVREYLEIYDKIKLKGTTPQEYKRIENFNSVPDLYNFIKEFKHDSESVESVSSKIIFENDKWVVYAVDNPEDACSLGNNTGWCTAPKNSNHYEGYASMGNLFVFINKFDKNEKYQFHFGSNQLADIDDRNIGMNGLRSHLQKGDRSDKDLLNNGLYDIEQKAADEYQDRYFDEQYNQFDMYFWDQVDNEMKNNIEGFESFNPKMQQYLVNMARDYLGEDLESNSTDMYGRPEVYVDWYGFFEHLKKDNLLEDIMQQEQHRINDQAMDEAGQGKLFEYPTEEEGKAAMYNNRTYNYRNLDEMLKKEAASILEKANEGKGYINLTNESFFNLLQRGYGNTETAFNDLKELILQTEFNQTNEANITFNMKGNSLIVEQDIGDTQLWDNPKEETTEEVNEHFLYPAIEIGFNKGERNKIYFSKINITDIYIPINEFTTDVDQIRGSNKEQKTPVSHPK